MLFRWDGVRFEKVDGVWYCRDWAMRGPIGCMRDKVVPSPYAEQIEASWREYLTRVNARVESKPIRPLADTVGRGGDNLGSNLEKIKEAVEKRRPSRRRKSIMGGVSIFGE